MKIANAPHPAPCGQIVVGQQPTFGGEGKHAPIYSASHRPLLCATPPHSPAPFSCAPSYRVRFLRRALDLSLHFLDFTPALAGLPFRSFPPLLGFANHTPTPVELHMSPLFLGGHMGKPCAGVRNLAHVSTPYRKTARRNRQGL